jgi:hypothetical protein
MQKRLKGPLEENFLFRNTRKGTRIITKETVDFSDIQSQFEE